jgi:hypothetical protein
MVQEEWLNCRRRPAALLAKRKVPKLQQRSQFNVERFGFYREVT